MIAEEAYVLSKSFTNNSLKGITGALAGKNCTIKSATKADGVTTVVFAWTADDGTEKTTTIQVNDGTDDYEDLINRPKIEGVDLIGNKTFEDLGAASAIDLAQTDGHLQDLADLVGDKVNLPMPNETVVDNIKYVDTKADELKGDLVYIKNNCINYTNILDGLYDSRLVDKGISNENGTFVINYGTYVIECPLNVEGINHLYKYNGNSQNVYCFKNNGEYVGRAELNNNEYVIPPETDIIKLEVDNKNISPELYLENNMDSMYNKLWRNNIKLSIDFNVVDRTLSNNNGDTNNWDNGAYCSDVYYTVNKGDIIITDCFSNGTGCSIAMYSTDKTYLGCSISKSKFTTLIAPCDGYIRFGTEHYSSVSGTYLIVNKMSNMFDYTDGILDKFKSKGISNENGTFVINYGTYVIDKIPVYLGEKIYNNIIGSYALYDINNEFILFEKCQDIITIPSGASYIAFEVKDKVTNPIIRNFQIPKTEDTSPSILYFDKNDDGYMESVAKTFKPKTERLDYRYKGDVNSSKRFLVIGFDDFRDSDFSYVIPMLNSYGAKSSFNMAIKELEMSNDTISKVDDVIYSGHELGDHTFHHLQFPFSDPLFDGTSFPTNEQMRNDRSDGKNAFGYPLTEKVPNYFMDIDKTWGDLSDSDCEYIRKIHSVFASPQYSYMYDMLSNMYLGTTGRSIDSWDSNSGKFTGGIFTGCSTSCNYEIWERLIQITQFYLKENYGLNYDVKIWSLPGGTQSPCKFEKDGLYYFDYELSKPYNYLSKFKSSLSNKNRSFTDVLRKFGYNISHDYLYPSREDGQLATSQKKQFYLNADLSSKDALLYPTIIGNSFQTIDGGFRYSKSFFSGNKSYAAQMYDCKAEFYNFVENIRNNTANGLIQGQAIDFVDSYGNRMLLEQILKFCNDAGIEVVSESTAYDICFNHRVCNGNLIYNPYLINTAKEVITDATNIPSNPDGYHGDCRVYTDADGLNVLETIGETKYIHYGIPLGHITYKANIKGTGNVKILAIKNGTKEDLSNCEILIDKNISNSVFKNVDIDFVIKNNMIKDYDLLHEGYEDKIKGIVVVYSENLNVKDIKLLN